MFDIDAFKRDLKKDLKAGRESFEGMYPTELNELLGLSREEIDQLTPDTTDLQEYDRLIALVRQASRHNLEQAELAARIRKLGDVAVSIAKKTVGLGSLLG